MPSGKSDYPNSTHLDSAKDNPRKKYPHHSQNVSEQSISSGLEEVVNQIPERNEERAYVVIGKEECRSGRRSRLRWNTNNRAGRRDRNLLFLWFLKKNLRE